MEIINILGNKLSNEIEISPPAARGLIKLAIKDEIGPFKPYNQIIFKEYESAILNSLKNRLLKLELKNVEKIIKHIKNELIEKQSLITMSNV